MDRLDAFAVVIISFRGEVAEEFEGGVKWREPDDE
jgi:hypothetical protein